MGAFLNAFFGPLISLIELLVSCLPHMIVVRSNEAGVKYPGGGTPVELSPGHWSCPARIASVLLSPCVPWPKRIRRIALIRGVHWYVPLVDQVETHHTCLQVLDVEPIIVETENGEPFAAGMVAVYRIEDVLAFEVGYFDADTSLAELGEGALRKLVLKSTLAELRDHRQGIDDKLATVCRRLLEDVGVDVVSARLTEQAQVHTVQKVFGLNLTTSIGGSE